MFQIVLGIVAACAGVVVVALLLWTAVLKWWRWLEAIQKVPHADPHDVADLEHELPKMPGDPR